MASVTLSALSRSGHARPLATPIGTELLVPAAARGRGKRPVPSITGKRRPYCSFVGSRRGKSAVSAWSVWQSFHAFGNDLAELHHLLAQSRTVYDVAMDAFAIGPQLFTQVVQITDQRIDLARRIAGNSPE